MDDVGGACYVDAAGGEDGAIVVVDLDVFQVDRFVVVYKDTSAVFFFDLSDSIHIKFARQEANLPSWNFQIMCW